MENNVPIAISIAHVIYYVYFQLVKNWVKSGTMTNTPNKIIQALVSEYNINVRTYQANKKHRGFNWRRNVYINEANFSTKLGTQYVFLHEYYHASRNHLSKVLVSRVVLALIPLTMYFVNPYICLLVYLAGVVGVHYLREYFEKKANEFADEKIKQYDKGKHKKKV